MFQYILIKDIMKKYLKTTHQDISQIFLHPKYSLGIYKEDILSKLNYYNYKHRILFIAGLPKSGTTWVENFIFNIPGYCPRNLSGDPDVIIRQNLPVDAFEKVPSYGYSYFKTHVNPTEENFKVLRKASIAKVVVMYRDPRDVSVSRYFHLLKKPKKPGDPNYFDYRNVNKDKGLSFSIDIDIAHHIPWIKGWLYRVESDPENHFVIRYEDLLARPLLIFKKMLDFYSICLSRDEVERIFLETQKMKKKKFLSNVLVGKKSTFRKGTVGDWRNHWNDVHKKKFKDSAGDFLIELGYENDLDW